VNKTLADVVKHIVFKSAWFGVILVITIKQELIFYSQINLPTGIKHSGDKSTYQCKIDIDDAIEKQIYLFFQSRCFSLLILFH
jgi:hypothetical protein